MGEIMKRKKKGRPSKSDLSRRPTKERELRRSIRRRSVRYTIDFDDYIDYNEEYDYDDLPPSPTDSPSSTSSAYFDLNNNKPLRKRKINHQLNHTDEDDDNDEVGVSRRKPQHTRVNSLPATPLDFSSGIPLPEKSVLELILDKLQKKDIYGVYADPVDPDELPDYFDIIKHPMDFTTVRRKLENGKYLSLEQFESDVFLICANAMQYNEPDTIYYKQAFSIEELAKKKFQGLRINVERSEKEVKTEQKNSNSLIKKLPMKSMSRTMQGTVGSDFSSGASLATASDFQNGSRGGCSNSLTEKLTMKSMSQTVQEPVGSDFSSGATLATAGDFQNGSSAVQGSCSLIESNLDKGEELLREKGPVPKLGKKPSVHDENCQATYNMSDQPISTTESVFTTFDDESKHLGLGKKPSVHDENRRSTYNMCDQPISTTESIFTTFEDESKHLVPVGLHTDHSYATSLARYAATLGSVAWNMASQRIEHALPPESKFGRGWVGEYEPLPTPVLMVDEPSLFTRSHCTADTREDDQTSRTSFPATEHHVSRPSSEGKTSFLAHASSSSGLNSAKEDTLRGVCLDGKLYSSSYPVTRPKFFVNANNEQQSSQSKKFVEFERKMIKETEANCPSSANQSTQSNFVAARQISNCSKLPDSKSMETVSRDRNLLQSVSFKQSNIDGVAGGLPNGIALNNSLHRDKSFTSSPESFTNPLARMATYTPQAQEHGLRDPVQLMRMSAEKAQNKPKSSDNSIQTVVPSLRSEDVSNASNPVGNAWMSIGAAGGFKPGVQNTSTHKNHISPDSSYYPTLDRQPQTTRFRGEFPVSGMQYQQANNNTSPLHAFVGQPVRMGNQPLVFPQLVREDLSRFQVQSPWRDLNPQNHPRHKQESFPPDLNIIFSSSGSPVRQSSGVIVDSQQPDLALQL